MEVLFDWIVYMVQSAGLEPATSSFAGRRSNPTELRLQMVPKVGLEPTHRMASASKTDVSTNSTIWAYTSYLLNRRRAPLSNVALLMQISFSGVWLQCVVLQAKLAFPHIYQFHHLGKYQQDQKVIWKKL